MTNYIDFLPKFNACVERCENLASIARTSNLQKDAIQSLMELREEILKLKEAAILETDEDNANAYLALECAASSLMSYIQMWVLLKESDPDTAWNKMIDAQTGAIAAIRAHKAGAHLEMFSSRLHEIERLIFPSQVFASTGLIVKEEECSICGDSYDDCDHVSGNAYMGIFCHIIAKDFDLKEISLVNEPADKRCRITHFDDSEGRRNRMTWEIEPDEKI